MAVPVLSVHPIFIIHSHDADLYALRLSHGFQSPSILRYTLQCTTTIGPPLVDARFGGKSTSPRCRSLNSCWTSSPSTSPVRSLLLNPEFLTFLTLSLPTVWQRAAHANWIVHNLPHVADCAGTNSAAIFGMLLITSYLFLFIDFYLRTYKGSAANAKKGVNGVANGASKKVL